MKQHTAKNLQRAIMKARPWTPTALILRVSYLFPKIQPVFMKFITVIDDEPNPCAYLYTSLRNGEEKPEWFPRTVFYLAEKIVPDFIANAVLRFVIKKMLVPYFIVVDEKSFMKTKKRYDKDGSKIILDIVGEAAHTEEEANTYMESYQYVMREFGGHMAVKPSSLAWKPDKELLKAKFAELFTKAKKYPDVSTTIDAEEYFEWCKITEDAFFETVLDPLFYDMQNEIGIALQTYRKDAYASALSMLTIAEYRRHPIRVRVVKGAYWGEEHDTAKKLGKDFPVFETQEETDAMFERIAVLFMQNRKYIHPYFGTHNAKHIAFVLNLANGDYTNFGFEVLAGMGESIRRVLSKMRYASIFVYNPLIRKGGDWKEGMKYLIRRMKEVTGSSHVLKNI
jgi:RHH-type proline utilization regulon transcriptional repressor/proline dehydrogenase/delta 1-pyrroline-5-carboxylate dehydrogenase